VFRSVDVDFVDVDAAQDVVGVIGWAAPHGDQVEDFRLLAAFLPTHFSLGTFVLFVRNLYRNVSIKLLEIH
jgi:hypothetical protein